MINVTLKGHGHVMRLRVMPWEADRWIAWALGHGLGIELEAER